MVGCSKAALDPFPEFARDEGVCHIDGREFTLLKERDFWVFSPN